MSLLTFFGFTMGKDPSKKLELIPFTSGSWISCSEGNKVFGNPTTLTMLLSHGSPIPTPLHSLWMNIFITNMSRGTWILCQYKRQHISTMSINVSGRYVRRTNTTHMQVNRSGAISGCRKSRSQYVEIPRMDVSSHLCMPSPKYSTPPKWSHICVNPCKSPNQSLLLVAV